MIETMFFDLTMPLGPSTPVYPGDPPVTFDVANTFAEAGCLDHFAHLGTHAGTHMDAPAHMIEGGAMLNQYGPARFIGNGVLVELGAEDPDLSRVHRNDIVLFHTRISDDYSAANYYSRLPNISEATATALVGLGVKAVGVDAGSVDESPFAIHKTLLAGNVLIIENLIALDQLTEVDSFRVIALPLRVDIEAAPARVVAEAN